MFKVMGGVAGVSVMFKVMEGGGVGASVMFKPMGGVRGVIHVPGDGGEGRQPCSS